MKDDGDRVSPDRNDVREMFPMPKTIINKKAAGRPTSISKAKIKAICETIKLGATLEAAASSAGITRQTLYNWLERGEAEKDNPTGKDSLFLELFDEYARALGTAEEQLIKIIRDAAKTDWRAGAWILERRFPKNYGRQQVDVDFNGKLVVEDKKAEMRGLLGDEEAMDAAELIARKMTAKND